MTLVVNGEPRTLPDGSSVADLVRNLGLEKEACAVEVNKRLVPKARHAGEPLNDGDAIEVVTLVGGG
jgi:thiamine biosynthesis protein ThiS